MKTRLITFFKPVIDVFAFIGFYLVGGFLFLYRLTIIVLNLIEYGSDFNQIHESLDSNGDVVETGGYDLDNLKYYFLIGLLSGAYLFLTNQLNWIKRFFKK